jgi:hypothetical protein
MGFMLVRKPRPGDEKPDLANWMRCFLSQRLSQPAAAAEETANAEGKAAGRREEEEGGGDDADHLVVMVNGLYGRCARARSFCSCVLVSLILLFRLILSLISSADWKFAAEQFVKRLPGKVYVHRECSYFVLVALFHLKRLQFIIAIRKP